MKIVRCLYLSIYMISATAFAADEENPIDSFQSASFEMVQEERKGENSKFWYGSKNAFRKFLVFRAKNTVLHGHVQDSAVRWKWGLKNEIGFTPPHTSLHISAAHTHFHTKSFASLQKGVKLIPSWEKPGSLKAKMLGESSRSSWRLDMEISDLEVGKIIPVNSILDLRPHVGIRGSLMRQNFQIKEESPLVRDLLAPGFWSSCLALGARSGVDTLWRVGRSLQFFGDAAFSLLSGQHNMYEGLSASSQTGDQSAMTIMEYSLGAQYTKEFQAFPSILTVKLGYEMSHLFQRDLWMNWFSSIASDKAKEDLSMQGISLGFRLAF